MYVQTTTQNFSMLVRGWGGGIKLRPSCLQSKHSTELSFQPTTVGFNFITFYMIGIFSDEHILVIIYVLSRLLEESKQIK